MTYVLILIDWLRLSQLNHEECSLYPKKKRGVRMRWITEITRENIPYCMEATNFAVLRHLDRIMASGYLYFRNPHV